MAAITENPLTGDSSTTDATSFNTASITPTADRLILVAISARNISTAIPTPTVTGNGITYELVDSYGSGSTPAVFLFRGMNASPSAGAITISFGSTTIESICWSVSEYANVKTTGTNGSNAITQSNTGTGSGATSLTVNLGAFESSDNATFGMILHTANEATTQGSGFSLIHSTSKGTPTNGLGTEWRNDNDTTVDMTWTTSTFTRGIAAELRNASVGRVPTRLVILQAVNRAAVI